jgi:hypothetical protein
MRTPVRRAVSRRHGTEDYVERNDASGRESETQRGTCFVEAIKFLAAGLWSSIGAFMQALSIWILQPYESRALASYLAAEYRQCRPIYKVTTVVVSTPTSRGCTTYTTRTTFG